MNRQWRLNLASELEKQPPHADATHVEHTGDRVGMLRTRRDGNPVHLASA
jgi:hypothetical protein